MTISGRFLIELIGRNLRSEQLWKHSVENGSAIILYLYSPTAWSSRNRNIFGRLPKRTIVFSFTFSIRLKIRLQAEEYIVSNHEKTSLSTLRTKRNGNGSFANGRRSLRTSARASRNSEDRTSPSTSRRMCIRNCFFFLRNDKIVDFRNLAKCELRVQISASSFSVHTSYASFRFGFSRRISSFFRDFSGISFEISPFFHILLSVYSFITTYAQNHLRTNTFRNGRSKRIEKCEPSDYRGEFTPRKSDTP